MSRKGASGRHQNGGLTTETTHRQQLTQPRLWFASPRISQLSLKGDSSTASPLILGMATAAAVMGLSATTTRTPLPTRPRRFVIMPRKKQRCWNFRVDGVTSDGERNTESWVRVLPPSVSPRSEKMCMRTISGIIFPESR